MVCGADWFAMAELDPRLIRMRARQFHGLQGGRQVAVAVFFQMTAQTWLATRSELWTGLGGAAAFFFYIGLLAIADRHYARFGRVVPPSPPRWAFFVFIFAVNIFLPMPTNGFPNLVWSALAGAVLWLAWACRPFRWHHLLTSAATLYLAFGGGASTEAGDLAWLAPGMWAFTSARAIGGVLDHRLFVRAMRQTRTLAAEAS